MSRKPNQQTSAPESAPLPAKEIALVQNAAAAATKDAMKWMQASAAGGALQAFSYVATVADSAMVAIYEKVKKSEIYKGAPYFGEGGEPATCSDLETYCQIFLGKSYRRCEELLANRNLLGPEAYEQAQRLGLGQRDYNALKKLPQDDRALMKQAIEGGANKEAVVEKLVALTERVIAEKAQTESDMQKLRGRVEDQDGRIEKLTHDVEKQAQRADKAARVWRAAKPDDQRQTLEQAVQQAANAVRDAIGMGDEPTGLAGAVHALTDHAAEHSYDPAAFLGDVFARLLVNVQVARDDETLNVAIPIHEISVDDWRNAR